MEEGKGGVEGPEISFATGFHHMVRRARRPPPYSAMLFEGENNYRMTTSKPGDDTVLRGCAMPKQKVEWFFQRRASRAFLDRRMHRKRRGVDLG